ncbi:MAG: pyridoxamine 5'-phosphate oxidase family protein [Bacteroidales bacterium]|nr:pyridoxamine 5'-phosphate oxidase family protein [Bacteroidales bacterium]
MKRHQLTEAETEILLTEASVGRIATNYENGYPYVVPVHFVYLEKKIYVHGLIKGQKISNILSDPKVGFEVDEMGDLTFGDNPCDTNTIFKSVIILGDAVLVNDVDVKIKALRAIVQKYTPQLSDQEFPEKMIKATGIIEISIKEVTGKYYK